MCTCSCLQTLGDRPCFSINFDSDVDKQNWVAGEITRTPQLHANSCQHALGNWIEFIRPFCNDELETGRKQSLPVQVMLVLSGLPCAQVVVPSERRCQQAYAILTLLLNEDAHGSWIVVVWAGYKISISCGECCKSYRKNDKIPQLVWIL